jgi:hypothetical protein
MKKYFLSIGLAVLAVGVTVCSLNKARAQTATVPAGGGTFASTSITYPGGNGVVMTNSFITILPSVTFTATPGIVFYTNTFISCNSNDFVSVSPYNFGSQAGGITNSVIMFGAISNTTVYLGVASLATNMTPVATRTFPIRVRVDQYQ